MYIWRDIIHHGTLRLNPLSITGGFHNFLSSATLSFNVQALVAAIMVAHTRIRPWNSLCSLGNSNRTLC